MGFPVRSVVKNPPAEEKQIRFLGWEDPLEKEMADDIRKNICETSKITLKVSIEIF